MMRFRSVMNSSAASAAIGAVTLFGLLGAAGCEPCGRTGVAISADAKTTTITAPPGGGSRSVVEILGHNFTPNAPITLSFRQYPAADPGNEQFQRSTTANASGDFDWVQDLFTLPPIKFTSDPSVDVWITAKETSGGCFATTSIKAGTLLNPPLK